MEDVIKYYNDYNEDIRLEKTKLHKLEYLTTIRFLDNILIPNSRVLDVCAGAGRYSFYLESKGHSVTAVDITPRFVDIMNEKKKALCSKIDIHLGDARDLSVFESESFDTVLCMGALYHLKQYMDRKKAIEQCLNSLKKDGIFVVSYINRYASFIMEFSKMGLELDSRALNEILNNGSSFNGTLDSFYFSSPEEIDELMNNFNLEKICNIGTDGVGYMLSNKILNSTEEEYNLWLDFHYKTCKNVGYSLHGLYIGRKK